MFARLTGLSKATIHRYDSPLRSRRQLSAPTEARPSVDWLAAERNPGMARVAAAGRHGGDVDTLLV